MSETLVEQIEFLLNYIENIGDIPSVNLKSNSTVSIATTTTHATPLSAATENDTTSMIQNSNISIPKPFDDEILSMKFNSLYNLVMKAFPSSDESFWYRFTQDKFARIIGMLSNTLLRLNPIKKRVNFDIPKVTKWDESFDADYESTVKLLMDKINSRNECNLEKPLSNNKRSMAHTLNRAFECADDNKTAVPGLFLFNNFITESESDMILSVLSQHEWYFNTPKNPNKRNVRRTQTYGLPFGRCFVTENLRSTLKVMPLSLQQIGDKIDNFIYDIGLSNEIQHFNQCFVNEYGSNKSGNELSLHIDPIFLFEDIICGISLLSDCQITFADNQNIFKIDLAKNSLYIMTGLSRSHFRHGFFKGDINNHRISLTYRTDTGHIFPINQKK